MSLIIIRSHAEAFVHTYKRIYDVYKNRRVHPYTINTHLSYLMQWPLGPAFVCHGPPYTANFYPMLIPVNPHICAYRQALLLCEERWLASAKAHTHTHETGPVLPKQLGRVNQEILILRLGSGQFLLVMLWSIRRSDAGLPPNGVLHCEREGMRAGRRGEEYHWE